MKRHIISIKDTKQESRDLMTSFNPAHVFRITSHIRFRSFKIISGAMRKKTKLHISLVLIGGAVLWSAVYFSGLYIYLIERSYSEFSYPLEGDIQKYVKQLMEGQNPDVAPINDYNHAYLLNNKKCHNDKGEPKPIHLLLLIKSAIPHKEERNAIRKSWGWEKRFSDVVIQRVFVLGMSNSTPEVQTAIVEENQRHGDLLQFDFVDAYYNNTIKTMLGLRWAVEMCSSASYVMFSDDDMYVSVKNVLRFLRNPHEYPQYLQRNILEAVNNRFETLDSHGKPAHLLAGYVFFSRPHRYITSKWYMPYEEYAFSKYPPYVTAGAFIMTHHTVKQLYLTSKYVKHFRFDDVYLGILAKKSGIQPHHIEDVYYWSKAYEKEAYKYVIAAHGFDPKQLLKAWDEQRTSGNA